MKYIKRPVVIESYQLTPDNISFLTEWSGMILSGDETTDFYFIPTLEGKMQVGMYDYIIKGVVGEFYPCKRDIFELTYQPAEQSLDSIKKEWANDMLDEESICEFGESGVTYNKIKKEYK